MIWHYATSQDVVMCKQLGCWFYERHEPLRNPNLNLLLVCHQSKLEIEMLDLQYRFIVDDGYCHDTLCERLKSGVLYGKQIAVEHNLRRRYFWKRMYDRIVSETLTKHTLDAEYVASRIHIEQGLDERGRKGVYLVYTFPDSPTATPATTVEESATSLKAAMVLGATTNRCLEATVPL
jgi:hypothetical protein